MKIISWIWQTDFKNATDCSAYSANSQPAAAQTRMTAEHPLSFVCMVYAVRPEFLAANPRPCLALTRTCIRQPRLARASSRSVGGSPWKPYVHCAGGKRLRPALLLLRPRWLPPAALQLAAAGRVHPHRHPAARRRGRRVRCARTPNRPTIFGNPPACWWATSSTARAVPDDGVDHESCACWKCSPMPPTSSPKAKCCS